MPSNPALNKQNIVFLCKLRRFFDIC